MLFVKRFLSLYTILLALVFIFFLLTHVPNIDRDDAYGYIHFDAVRPLIYPIFIWLFRWAGSLQFILIMWAEAALLFFTLLHARSWLKKNLNIPEFLIFIVFCITLSTIAFHHQLTQIGPKGLAFPFFIITFFCLVECAREFNFRKLIYLSLMINVLILLRLQFYYFYIILALVYIWHLWRQKTSYKPVFLSLILAIVISASATAANGVYHYINDGHFSESPAGDVLAIKEFYLANNEHIVDYFKNKQEKEYVAKIYQEINKKKLNQDSKLLAVLTPSYYEFANQSYNRNSFDIFYTINNIVSKLSPTEKHKMLWHISLVLASHDIKENILFSLWNFIEDMGGVPLFLFLSILMMTAIYKILKDRNHTPSILEVFVLICILIIFANASEISLVQDYEDRYFIYGEFIFYCLAAILSKEVFLMYVNSHHSANEVRRKSAQEIK